jgi:glutaminyl-peptide cyclotransferase
MADGRLYESTGLYGESTLREVDAETGAVLRSISLADEYFGEGIAVVGDRLIQLTWQEHTALVYQLSDFAQVATFAYETEGWGLCDDGSRLVMSNGSSRLQFRDRSTFELQGTIQVTNAGEPVEGLNELECVGVEIYANVHRTDTIVRIDALLGVVIGEIDASFVVNDPAVAGTGVMNGIAYDPAAQTFLITGKNWPVLFEVRFVRR